MKLVRLSGYNGAFLLDYKFSSVEDSKIALMMLTDEVRYSAVLRLSQC